MLVLIIRERTLVSITKSLAFKTFQLQDGFVEKLSIFIKSGSFVFQHKLAQLYHEPVIILFEIPPLFGINFVKFAVP